MNLQRSELLYQQALACIPGGVNSPVRACKSVDADPLFIDRAEGSRVFDADGNAYIDYIGSWGPMILGHRHPAVIEALAARAAADVLVFGGGIIPDEDIGPLKEAGVAAIAALHDRGLLLADGLFETLWVEAGRAQLLRQHQQRPLHWTSRSSRSGFSASKPMPGTPRRACARPV